MLAGEGTLPASFSGLNQWGAITGLYYDVNYVFHGYVRDPAENFHDFEAPGADTTDSFYGTFPTSISDFGTVVGYSLNTGGVYRGFLRYANGTFQTFDAPGADTVVGDFNGTFPQSNNDGGATTGYYLDANEVYHGFLRTADGKYVTIDAPDADLTSGSYSGTFPTNINGEGLVTGYFIDSIGVAHGFLRIRD
jgi:probable HAF family extracellular repeat protein